MRVGRNAVRRGRLSHRRNWRSSVTAIVACFPAWAVGAATWEVVPKFNTELSYETNPDNTSNQSNEDDAYILTVTPSARFAWESPKGGLTFDPRLRFRDVYGNDGNSQLDGTDIILPATGVYRGLRSQTNLSAGYTQYPSREADYQVVDPNNPVPPGGLGCEADIRGRCRVDETQSRWYVNPGFSYSLSPRFLIGVNGSYSAIRYDEAEVTGRFNYDYFAGSLSVTRLLAEQHQISLSLNAAHYEADQKIGLLENSTDTAGVSLGYEYALSPSTTLSVAGGASISDFAIDGRTTVGGLPCFDPDLNEFVLCRTEGQDTNFIGELFLRQRLDESITAQVGVSRSVQPTSDGAETTVDYATAFIERNITKRLRASAGASFTKQKAIGADDIEFLRQRFDREYYRLELKAFWQLSRHWTISGQYAYYLDDQSVFSPFGFGDASIDSRNQIFSLALQYVGSPIR